MTTPEELFWELAAELRDDPRIQEGRIMNSRCLRVGEAFLALVDDKGSGLVVKLPKHRVEELLEAGVGKPFAPAGKTFKEWLAVPTPEPALWRTLLREGVAFVTDSAGSCDPQSSTGARRRARGNVAGSTRRGGSPRSRKT